MPTRQATPEGQHPLYTTWVADETRMRATYHGLQRLLVDYLVPHRFEAGEDTKPKNLRRAQYGYVPKLNSQFVGELAGHVRGAVTRYMWGPMEETDAETDRRREEAGENTITERPAGGLAQTLWDDATLDGTPWRKFFGGKVLEWGLSSVGGFVLCDVPDIPGELTVSEERKAGRRPFATFIPMSQVVDLGLGGFGFGFRWIEIVEEPDTRQPMGREQPDGPEQTRLLYELQENGTVLATRRNADGEPIPGEEPVTLGPITDTNGFPVLPLVPVFFGEHPEVPFIGEGLILGLDDVVIDIFNRLSETVEGFRDGAFTVHWFKGDGFEAVKQSAQNGSRLWDLGNTDGAAVGRLEGGMTEVTGGMELIQLALQAWAVGAKRKAAEAMERAEARSGVSLKAEFQLDSRPLLTEIAEWLDSVETNCMWVMAQLAGHSAEEVRDVAAERDTTFQIEDEAARISRILQGFTTSVGLPATLTEAAIMKWAEASGLVDMDAEVVDGTGARVTVRDLLRREAAEIGAARQRRETERGGLFGGFNEGFGALPPDDEDEGDELAPAA